MPIYQQLLGSSQQNSWYQYNYLNSASVKITKTNGDVQIQLGFRPITNQRTGVLFIYLGTVADHMQQCESHFGVSLLWSSFQLQFRTLLNVSYQRNQHCTNRMYNTSYRGIVSIKQVITLIALLQRCFGIALLWLQALHTFWMSLLPFSLEISILVMKY